MYIGNFDVLEPSGNEELRLKTIARKEKIFLKEKKKHFSYKIFLYARACVQPHIAVMKTVESI